MKYVFVCGLHRSGTTLLAREIGKLKNCTGFEKTGVLMDEGQFLQDVYPPFVVHGGAGKFGFAPAAHLTESSPLLTPTNVSRLRRSWEAYWDSHKTIRIEKTPGNLIMTRFLQAAFPNAHFIVIKRHPVPVSLATQKWSRTPLHNLFEHWLRCHEIFAEDRKYLTHLYELSYEDYIKEPNMHLKKIADFIGTEFSSYGHEEIVDVYNVKYLVQWGQMLRTSPCRLYFRHVARLYEKKFAEHGYSVVPSFAGTSFCLDDAKLSSRIIGPLLCLAWDFYAIPWRADLRFRVATQRVAHRYLPERVRRMFRKCQASVARYSLWNETGSSK
jgi:hypothetical protein